MPGPTHSSSLKEERQRATTRLPTGRMRSALESMLSFLFLYLFFLFVVCYAE